MESLYKVLKTEFIKGMALRDLRAPMVGACWLCKLVHNKSQQASWIIGLSYTSMEYKEKQANGIPR